MKKIFFVFFIAWLSSSCGYNKGDTGIAATTSATNNVDKADTIHTPVNTAASVKIGYGDLVFIDVDCGPFCDAIIGVTPSYQNLPINHVGLKVKYNDEPYIIEAGSNGVKMIPTGQFLKKAKSFFMVAQLKPAYRHLIDSAMAFAIRQMDKPYDKAFVMNNDQYYCSELIYDAFKYANKGQAVFDLAPMTFKAKGTDNILPEWIAYFKELKIPVPEGELGCNPGEISMSDKLEVKGVMHKSSETTLSDK